MEGMPIKYGNLIKVLKDFLDEERVDLDYSKMPSQEDLKRWALKYSVYKYYAEMDLENDVDVVDMTKQDRLLPDFAPDFDKIYNIWFDKIEELSRRKDKYGVTMQELDEVEEDMYDGMRGSAFEKRLDRYRKDFVKKMMETNFED